MPQMRALVTGGAARLGRAMALFLGGRGYDVAVHFATSAEQAEATVDEIKAQGVQAVSVQADLLQEGQTETLIQRATDALGGPLSALINNASIFEYDTLGTATRESWDRHIESNLRAPFVLTQRFADQVPDPETDENGEPEAQGLIVNMIDQRVHKLTPEFMSYTLAKAGLWTLTQTSAQALAPKVRVNGIGPGPTLKGSAQSEEQFARQRKATLLMRGANPADITAALGYLLDAPSVTGQMINVDGGQHLAWQTPDVVGLE
ncbi:NAD(P)-dependent dehydrogenase, short-chain alcohol dehydrogenase family [Cognatiyoonia sediminum]|uniref:NAD(P)-dependent dehydrogenase, short-chain alcohol dehydrogenase family n=2 Tax=Cognatiyoonia sediminum TaxID=1508389 RepID=A0A1M5Q0A5_9RHOB|nr:NAD(P)-dependent dehydrogenase, short-chain alcohol dehydrogenase family [Cognatiyoonia sediminum]